MSVQYKFRSSVNFDSVDIGSRPSISVRDLKSKIVQDKKLSICQDFELVFCDARTGQEYTDDDFQISSGSSVIIKRVPAGSVHCDMACNGSFAGFGMKDNNKVNTSCQMNAEINFDDFGADLCPVPVASLSRSDIDKKIYIPSERKNIDSMRCSKPPIVGCQKLEASDLIESIPRENTVGTKPKPAEPFMKLGKAVNVNPPDMQNTNFPLELKCSLCNTLFKEAVMIPCCQHSFCEKCIRVVLVEKARCPKCFSSKCRVEDLLPNVSLRQAIEHFLESQMLINVSENALHHYAPDGESGIQAEGISCAMTVLQREPGLPDSPSATGKGSNQIVAESAYVSALKNKASIGGEKSMKCRLPQKMKQIDGERHGSGHLVDFKGRPMDLADFAEFQGESQPIHEEAESSIQKTRALMVNTSGVDKTFMESGRHRKGYRTCYMCGSPDHFIRDCPAALSPNPMLQTGNGMFPGAMHGYASPYWNGPPLPHVRPFANIYGSPGMMPFNASMVPATPYAVPTYMPSMCGGLPAYGGFMRMGGATTPAGINVERNLFHPGILDLRDCEKRRKLSNEDRSEQSFDDDEDVNKRCRSDEAERLHGRKSRMRRERSVSYSEGSFAPRSHKRHRRDSSLDDYKYSVDEKHEKSSRSSISGRERRHYHHSERLSSEVDDRPSSSSWHDDDRYKNHSRNTKKQNERREQCHSDSSWSRHPINKEKDAERKRVKSDVKRHKQKHNRSESGLEHSSSNDQKKKQKKKDLSHGARHSRHKSRSMDEELSRDRWSMVRDPDDDGEEDHRHRKRKSVY